MYMCELVWGPVNGHLTDGPVPRLSVLYLLVLTVVSAIHVYVAGYF